MAWVPSPRCRLTFSLLHLAVCPTFADEEQATKGSERLRKPGLDWGDDAFGRYLTSLS